VGNDAVSRAIVSEFDDTTLHDDSSSAMLSPRARTCARRYAAVAAAFALVIGAPAFRLRGAYFAIGTLALGEILRTTVGNALPEISTLPAASIAGYRLTHRYYLALALAVCRCWRSRRWPARASDSACRRSARTSWPPRPPAWARSG
jgi:hypothetical protein